MAGGLGSMVQAGEVNPLTEWINDIRTIKVQYTRLEHLAMEILRFLS